MAKISSKKSKKEKLKTCGSMTKEYKVYQKTTIGKKSIISLVKKILSSISLNTV